MSDMKEINLLELFSGIGGFTKGFEQAGYTIKEHFFSEIDKHAVANYKYNYPHAKHLKSVTDVYGRNLPNIDVITFGSPCQDFSLAGKQLGMEGQRSVLILEAIRIIRECRPSVFIWENVKGVFSSNNGADFWAVLAAFANIGGYRLEWQLLNTSWFLPQNRERIYLIGHSANGSECGVFPITESNRWTNEGATNASIVRCLTAGGKSGGHHSGMTLINQINDKKNFGGKSTKQQDRVYASDGLMACIPSGRTESKVNISIVSKPHGFFNGAENFNNSPTVKCGSFEHQNFVKVAHVSRTDEAKEIRKQSIKNGKDYTPFQGKKLEFKDSDVMNTITCATQKDNLIEMPFITNPKMNNYEPNYDNSVAITATSYKEPPVVNNIRRLTEIECERLQGFEDNWTKWGIYEKQVWTNKKEWVLNNGTKKTFEIIESTHLIPKTQRYKMCGNAVTVNVVQAIAERIKFLTK